MAVYNILQIFYASDEWINFRHLIILQRGLICQNCGNVIDESETAILHHKKELTPENVKDKMISVNPDNVLLVHAKCHNQIHNRFSIKKHNVYLVYGPPLSGKKTYVKNNMSVGDLIVDIDLLYQSLSMNELYNKPNNLFNNVMAVHNLIIDNIKTRFGKWNNAYIIGGYADKYKRDKLINDLGAEPILIDTSKEECISRIDKDNARRYKKNEYVEYINKWFDNYTPL